MLLGSHPIKDKARSLYFAALSASCASPYSLVYMYMARDWVGPCPRLFFLEPHLGRRQHHVPGQRIQSCYKVVCLHKTVEFRKKEYLGPFGDWLSHWVIYCSSSTTGLGFRVAPSNLNWALSRFGGALNPKPLKRSSKGALIEPL